MRESTPDNLLHLGDTVSGMYALAADVVLLAVQSGVDADCQARALALASELLRLARMDNGPSRRALTGSSPSGAAGTTEGSKDD